jgi:hypothetical protein
VGHAGYTKLVRELIAALRASVTLEESGAKEFKVSAAEQPTDEQPTADSRLKGG